MMNIFYLDNDPIKAAEYMCDKHIVKMACEQAQILSTAHRVLDGDKQIVKENGRTKTVYRLDGMRDYVLYKPTHVNHPSTVWAYTSTQNYQWLVAHYVALCVEYSYRFNKEHASGNPFLMYYLTTSPDNILDKGFTPPPHRPHK